MAQTSKQQLTTSLILCIFLGYLGAHKFYEKKYGLGIVYLFTFGIFGIGWIVDCVKLATATSNSNKVESIAPSQSIPDVKVNCTVHENEKTYRVTGTSHYVQAIKSLAKRNPQYHTGKKEILSAGLAEELIFEQLFNPQLVEVVPEPDNPYDSNAIKVLVDGVHVGYIKAGSCAHLLKVIKGNRIEQIRCEISGGSYKCYIDTSGVDEKPYYELDEGASPYRVTLYIKERKE